MGEHEWTNSQVICLVNEYRKRPMLWDPNDGMYRVQTAKYEAWSDLAEIFQCEIADLRKKLNSIFASHRREKSKVKSGGRSTWFLYPHMSFLPSHIENDKISVDVSTLENDVENYIRWKMMGGAIRIKRGIVPHMFDCQRPAAEKETRPDKNAPEKRHHVSLIQEASSNPLPSASTNVSDMEWVDCGNSNIEIDNIDINDSETFTNTNKTRAIKEIVKEKKYFQTVKEAESDRSRKICATNRAGSAVKPKKHLNRKKRSEPESDGEEPEEPYEEYLEEDGEETQVIIKEEPAEPAMRRESLKFLHRKPRLTRVLKRKVVKDSNQKEKNRFLEAVKLIKRSDLCKKKDECDTFGEYIASSLKKHDERTRSMIKQAINNILFEQEMKKYTTGEYIVISNVEENPLIDGDNDLCDND